MFSFFKRTVKPYDTGFVSVDHGHRIFYQQFGNPKGRLALMFHGGPGGRSKAKHALHYNLKKWRVIVFDQRGCGRSEYKDAFRENTPFAAIRDAMSVLDCLKIKGKITVGGNSFGSTLALLFAEKYPHRVNQLFLGSIFLMRPQDAAWVSHQSRLFYPDLMDEMRSQAKKNDIVSFYHKLIFSEKYKDIQQAQKYYGSYEFQLGSLTPSFDKTPALTDDYIRSGRIYLHYEKNHFFASENEIMDHIDKIKYIPALIVHNRLDLCCPVAQAYDLHKALPKSKLVIVPAIGHGGPKLYSAMDKEIGNIT